MIGSHEARHAAPHSHAHGTGRRRLFGVIALVAVAALVVVGALVVFNQPDQHSADAAGTHNPPPPPLRVTSITPAANATNVSSASPITVTFSAPISADTPMPILSPAVAGTWSQVSPTSVQFVASGPLVPGTTETVAVPSGASGPTGTKNQYVAKNVDAAFSVAPGSTLRLEQLLAQLGYMPVVFTPTGPAPSAQQGAEPQPGNFTWRWPNQPASLTSLWTAPGTPNVILTGAIMRFEDVEGLNSDGDAGPAVWGAVLQAVSTGQADPDPYGYVYVSENDPETVTVYQNGGVAYTTLANTGVAAAPTAQGTFTVYARYTTTTMSGTNPDGSTYVDPGIPWVSYFNGGDALHGYVRASYGFPQSDGCVEMPISNAAVVFPLTPLGTLVTVG